MATKTQLLQHNPPLERNVVAAWRRIRRYNDNNNNDDDDEAVNVVSILARREGPKRGERKRKTGRERMWESRGRLAFY